MQKIEFEADISKDGNLRLPEQYQAWFGKHAKLILLIPDDQVLSDKERRQKMAFADDAADINNFKTYRLVIPSPNTWSQDIFREISGYQFGMSVKHHPQSVSLPRFYLKWKIERNINEEVSIELGTYFSSCST